MYFFLNGSKPLRATSIRYGELNNFVSLKGSIPYAGTEEQGIWKVFISGDVYFGNLELSDCLINIGLFKINTIIKKL